MGGTVAHPADVCAADVSDRLTLCVIARWEADLRSGRTMRHLQGIELLSASALVAVDRLQRIFSGVCLQLFKRRLQELSG